MKISNGLIIAAVGFQGMWNAICFWIPVGVHSLRVELEIRIAMIAGVGAALMLLFSFIALKMRREERRLATKV